VDIHFYLLAIAIFHGQTAIFNGEPLFFMGEPPLAPTITIKKSI
jgi:hypothetical protein